jgi:hypothetical protein
MATIDVETLNQVIGGARMSETARQAVRGYYTSHFPGTGPIHIQTVSALPASAKPGEATAWKYWASQGSYVNTGTVDVLGDVMPQTRSYA